MDIQYLLWLQDFRNSILGSHWGKLVFSVLYAFYFIALVPLVLKLCGGKKASKPDFPLLHLPAVSGRIRSGE